MKYCFFVSVLDSKIFLGPYIDVVNQEKDNNADEFRFIFAVNSENKEMLEQIKEENIKNFEILENIEHKTEEALIKQFILSNEADQTIIIKNNYKLNDVYAINQLMIAGLNKVDIVTIKSPKTTKWQKFKSKLRTLFSSIINFMFGFKLYNGDTSVMLISKRVLETMKLFPTKIVRFTKVNSFVGFSEVSIDDVFCSSKKHLIPKEKIQPLIIFWTCFACLLIGHIVLSCTVKRLNTAVFHAFFTIADITSLLVSIYFAVSAKLSIEVGEFYEEKPVLLREKKIEKRD